MAFPKLLQRLFANAGAGPLLRKEIMPDELVKIDEQNFTDAQKNRARTNINAAANVAFTGATANAVGSAGLVPTPVAGDQGKVLFGSGAWTTIPADPTGQAILASFSQFATERGL